MKRLSFLVVVFLCVMELSNVVSGGLSDELKIKSIDLLMAIGVISLVLEYIPAFVKRLSRDGPFRKLLLQFLPLMGFLLTMALLNPDVSQETVMTVVYAYIIIMVSISIVGRYCRARMKKEEEEDNCIKSDIRN